MNYHEAWEYAYEKGVWHGGGVIVFFDAIYPFIKYFIMGAVM